MNFVIASYGPVDKPSIQPVSFGVVLNDGEKTYYYFDTSTKRRDEIKNISSHFDQDTFMEFQKTFVDMFIKPGVAYDTDTNGKRREINVNDEEFLSYLFQNSEGPYRYSELMSVEGNHPTKLVQVIASQLLR